MSRRVLLNWIIDFKLLLLGIRFVGSSGVFFAEFIKLFSGFDDLFVK